MANSPTDAPIIVPKKLRDRIKVEAAKVGLSMRDYLDKTVPEKKD